MRIAFFFLPLFALAGCATVSMVPTETTVESALSQEQTDLRAASDAFCDQVETAGWAPNETGFANLAAILMNGQSASDTGGAYLDGFEDTLRPDSDHLAGLVQDVLTAREGLGSVMQEVRQILSNETLETGRGDVTSFERALVKAQRASRTFLQARDTVAERAADTARVDEALAAFETDIDAARRLADALAARYAGLADLSA
ncbi:MAG: hypothetical protein AAGH87_05595 [Pseudomonadota bacterium]